MSELAEYELEDGTTVQLTAEDAKRIPGAKKTGKAQQQQTQQQTPTSPEHKHEPVQNRARRN